VTKKQERVLKLAPVLFFTLFMANFSYGVLNVKQPLKVAILDTGIADPSLYKHMCKEGHKNFSSDPTIKDTAPSKHGSNIAAIIEREAGPGNWCFIMIKYSSGGPSAMYNYRQALQYAVDVNPSVLNLSLTGRTYDFKEARLVAELLKNKVRIVAAAGNDGEYIDQKACTVYPACLDPAIDVIGNSGSRTSNRGPFVDRFLNGQDVQGAGVSLSGTSQSTAKFTGQLVKLLLQTY
jgi:hypothetical protein